MQHKISSLLFLCSLFAGFNTSAQWSGTNPITTTSSVGIGITTPVSKLQVNTGFTTDCNTYSGQPALKVVWSTPGATCPFPGPSGTPPTLWK